MELVHGGDWAGYRARFGHDALDFSANVSPLGLPQGVADAIVAALPTADRYPDPLCRELRTALSRAEQLPEPWILCGNGAADLIYRLVWALKPRRALLPAPTFAEYAAALESARAQVARAEAQLAQSLAQVERFRPLVAANAISKQDFVNAEAAYKAAQADVAAGKAAVRQAEINLGYTQVTSPIAGRIGRALVTEGALVGQGEATQLAVVQQIHPVYVNFTQSSTDLLRLRRAVEGGQLKKAPGQEGVNVRIVQADGSEYPLPGKLLFTDLSVDPSTGQVLLRAEVPNPKGELLPGLYVRVRIEQAQATNAITLPQQAVTRTQQGDTVNVVDKDGKVTPRTIKVSLAQDNRWVVQEGLQAGEQVMVDGFQKLMMLPPGTPVQAVPWQPPGTTPAPATDKASAPAASSAASAS